MSGHEAGKPAYDEWMYWTQVVIDRLTTVVHVYNKPPYSDVFMAEQVKQTRIATTVDILRRLHGLTDEDSTTLPLAQRDAKDEQVIADLQPLLKNVLQELPVFSTDMQQLLKSHWFDNCAGRVANELFKGPNGRLDEGIGSGLPDHGRLPAKLEAMLEREWMGDSRPMRLETPAKADITDRQDVAKLWAKRNAPLRTTGRIN
jgi:hypothetical protein